MKQLDWKYLPIGALFVFSTALAPVFRAQEGIAITRVRADPPDAYYTVDGAVYNNASSAAWPAGSKHILAAPVYQHPPGQLKVQYIFKQWEFGNSIIPLNPAPVTASTAIPEYLARFDVAYALSLVYFDCPDPQNCSSPGAIYINNTPYYSSTEVFLPRGSSVVMQAYPNPGFVFVGWAAANDQKIVGFQNTVTMNGPTSVYPKFSPARKINFQTVPPELQILADRAPIEAPASLDWGLDTVHSVGPVSPQQDKHGKYWAFQSWSDGGEPTHAYKVGSQASDILTATYVPAASVTILTQPVGLPIKVDGLNHAAVTPLNPYFFQWGVGEKHRIEAPLQQTDSQGRIWKFSGWSNGGDATQEITVPLDADTTGIRLTATYTQVAQLTVNSSLSSLTVQVDGKDCAVPCQVLRDIGENVRISTPTAIALNDSARLDFDGWPGGAAEYVATMTENAQNVAANYHTMNRFTASADPAGGVAWRVEPASNDGFYHTGEQVAVSVAAQPGYKFRRWEGDLSGSIPSGVVSMSAPRTVRAVLDAVPYIAPTGIMNAAGITPSTGVAAGSVISIFGANLAAGTEAAGDGMLPQTLAAVTVRVGDRLLPLIFVSPGQINAVLPDDLPEGQQLLVVSPQGQTEVRAVFTVVRNAPGIFGGAIHEDGSPVTSDAPARPGELLTVYGTGLGPTERPRLAGFPIPTSPEYRIADKVEVRIGDTAARVEKAVAAPGKVGIDVVRFRLPEGTESGSLKLIVNGVESNAVTVAVQ